MLSFSQQSLALCVGLWPQSWGLRPRLEDLQPCLWGLPPHFGGPDGVAGSAAIRTSGSCVDLAPTVQDDMWNIPNGTTCCWCGSCCPVNCAVI